jgi:hypothetical protein
MTPRHILLVAGPSGSGKSTLLHQLRDGTLAPEILRQLPADAARWPVIEANNVMKGDLAPAAFAQQVQAGGCLVHYDIVFIHCHGVRRYEDDPALRLLAQAASLQIVFVRPDITRLQEQYLGRLRQQGSAKTPGSRWWGRWVRRPIRRLKGWLTGQPVVTTANWYSREWWLADCYRQWERYGKSLVASHPGSGILCVEPVSRLGEPPAFRPVAPAEEGSAGAEDVAAGENSRGRRGWLTHWELADLVRDKLVLSALGGGRVTAASLREHGARDVLMLERQGPARAQRDPLQVRKGYRRIPDVRKNNCNVALLHGTSTFALMEKREFARFERVLVPAGAAWFAVALGLLMYGRRRALVVAGQTRVPCRGRPRRYLVLDAHVKARDQARQYGPAGLSHLELLQRLAGVVYVSLRGSEAMAEGRSEGDIDLLVSPAGLREFTERFSREVGVQSFDLYTEDGQGGYAYKSVPYFTAKLAHEMLQGAAVDEHGVRLASPHWRYLSYLYHLLFHDKVPPHPPGAPQLGPGSFTKPHYYPELQRLAAAAGATPPRTFEEMEQQLRAADVMPSLDMIGFYSNKNPFLKQRYFEHAPLKVGLATFFVRDFGNGVATVPELRARLQQTFEILAEGAVDDANHARVLKGVRGGNWVDAAAPGGRAEPVYWFVCWDPAPRLPSARTRRKHPRVDNENIRLKDDLRREFSGSAQALRLIHSSDNSREALEHLHHLGLEGHAGILHRLAAGGADR